jgi:hypothetical protein
VNLRFEGSGAQTPQFRPAPVRETFVDVAKKSNIHSGDATFQKYEPRRFAAVAAHSLPIGLAPNSYEVQNAPKGKLLN